MVWARSPWKHTQESYNKALGAHQGHHREGTTWALKWKLSCSASTFSKTFIHTSLGELIATRYNWTQGYTIIQNRNAEAHHRSTQKYPSLHKNMCRGGSSTEFASLTGKFLWSALINKVPSKAVKQLTQAAAPWRSCAQNCKNVVFFLLCRLVSQWTAVNYSAAQILSSTVKLIPDKKGLLFAKMSWLYPQ